MSSKRKLKPERLSTLPERQLVMRFVRVRREEADTTQSSVPVVIATENPVQRWDEDRGIVVNEIMEMDGLELRGGRDQLPIVDSHDRSTVANVLGSVRGIHVEGDELIGRAYFARDDASQQAYQKLLDGHLTDFSITADPLEIGFVERGKQYTNRRGEVIEGPADIVRKWQPTDASLVAAGADYRSVVRRSYTDIPRKLERQMDEALLTELVSMGLPEGVVEPNAVLAWVVGNMNATTPSEPVPIDDGPVASEDEMIVEDEPEEEVTAMDEEDKVTERADDEDKDKEKTERALKTERTRQKEIRAICEKAGIERAMADKLCDSGVSLDSARKQVLERMSDERKPVGTSVTVTEARQDKFLAAARDGLLTRAFANARLKRKPFEHAAPGTEDFVHARVTDIAAEICRELGCHPMRMNKGDMLKVALGHEGTRRRYNIRREAYHTTGNFGNLLADVANKTLLAAYEEAPYTWSMWARQAPAVEDFKPIYRMRLSEVGDLEMVPENHPYPEAALSDKKESYSVGKFGNIISISWETYVNDDLDALSRIPQQQARAARRTQNKLVYNVLTANAALADGGLLFNSTAQTTVGGHANLATSTGAPSVATLNAAYASFATKTGLSEDTILNIMPKYLIAPAALAGTVLELLSSTAPPDVGGSSVGTSGTANIYGPNGERPLIPIIEPYLDANSTTAWYLAADSNDVDTIELSFLQGEESPVQDNEWEFDTDTYKSKVRQTFGSAAIDFRGLYKNAG